MRIKAFKEKNSEYQGNKFSEARHKNKGSTREVFLLGIMIVYIKQREFTVQLTDGETCMFP